MQDAALNALVFASLAESYPSAALRELVERQIYQYLFSQQRRNVTFQCVL